MEKVNISVIWGRQRLSTPGKEMHIALPLHVTLAQEGVCCLYEIKGLPRLKQLPLSLVFSEEGHRTPQRRSAS